MDVLTALFLLSPCLLVIMLMIFLTVMRYISYRERIALAEHGIFPVEDSFWERISQRSPQGILWAGVITTMCGLALLLGLYTLGIGVWLLAGLIPLFVGLGMVFIYFTGGRTRGKAEEKGEPPLVEETVSVEQHE